MLPSATQKLPVESHADPGFANQCRLSGCWGTEKKLKLWKIVKFLVFFFPVLATEVYKLHINL